MAIIKDTSKSGEMKSQGGFLFGVVGYQWPTQEPTSITWYLDDTVSVFDQLGRPIRGVSLNGRRILFADRPPNADRGSSATREENHGFCTHLEAAEAMESENPPIEWWTLVSAGFPQLDIDRLRKIPKLPDVDVDQLHRIKNDAVRKDALLRRLEMENLTDERKKREQEQAQQEFDAAMARAKAPPKELAKTTK